MAKKTATQDKFSRFNDDGYGIRPIKTPAAKLAEIKKKQVTATKKKGK